MEGRRWKFCFGHMAVPLAEWGVLHHAVLWGYCLFHGGSLRFHPLFPFCQPVTWKKGVSFSHGWSQQSTMGLNGSGRAPRMWHKPLGILLVFFLAASILLLKGQQWTSLLRDFSHHHGGSASSVNFFRRLPTLPSILLYLQSFLVPIYKKLRTADRDVSWDTRSLALWGNSHST